MNRYNIGGTVSSGISGFASFVVANRQQRAISERKEIERQRAAKVGEQNQNYQAYKDEVMQNEAMKKYGTNDNMRDLIRNTEADQTTPEMRDYYAQRFGANAGQVMNQERADRLSFYAESWELQPVGRQAVDAYTRERTSAFGGDENETSLK